MLNEHVQGWGSGLVGEGRISRFRKPWLQSRNRPPNPNPALSPAVSGEDLPSVPPTMRLNVQEETGRIIEMQRLEIQRLRDQIQEQEQVPGFHPLAGMQLPSLSREADLKAQTK